MKNKKLYSILVAHSDKNYMLGCTIGLSQKGYSILKQTTSGIEALQFILQHKPDVAIIEDELPLLSAYDIIKTAISKEITTKFVVVFPIEEQQMLKPLSFVKIHEVYYCNSTIKVALKVLSKLFNSPKHWFYNIISQRFQDSSNENLKMIQSLSNDELAILLNLPECEKTEISLDSQESFISKGNKKLATIALKLKLKNSTLHLKEWSAKNNTLLKAFSLSNTQDFIN